MVNITTRLAQYMRFGKKYRYVWDKRVHAIDFLVLFKVTLGFVQRVHDLFELLRSAGCNIVLGVIARSMTKQCYIQALSARVLVMLIGLTLEQQRVAWDSLYWQDQIFFYALIRQLGIRVLPPLIKRESRRIPLLANQAYFNPGNKV